MIVKPGDRIEMVNMPDDPDPIPRGARGTVTHVSDLSMQIPQISVEWDSGRSLNVLVGIDLFKIV